ncbi:uncharacterized protein F5891DRAFT_982044 [Suillus fuscotomentosus]|uniref:Protein phosphatase methylesterase-1 n=1 Tax=Suillus fuscotomentosus TaxID=1912939 RepID=A0AAD4E1T1_9AGAM|nr:uncharacterized protein F5891DRAFT_982044 [Suillus fuscotomentosus]KAG1898131.1 hypothetical protein F5891DRAFT_982044 [Suillus fuscotomentosus]
MEGVVTARLKQLSRMSRRQQAESAMITPEAGLGLVIDIAAALVSHCHGCAEEIHSKEKARHEPTMGWVVIVQHARKYWIQIQVAYTLRDSWFPSLSSLFLGLHYARLLVLAGAERLDTTLTVSQMQGKFWLEVMASSGVGHLMHEDGPTKLAEILADFWMCNERIMIRGNVTKMVGEV